MSRRLAAASLLFLVPWGCGGVEPPIARSPERAPAPETEPPGPIPVVKLHREGSRLVTIRIAFDAGSADDPAGKEGATALAARLQVEGGTQDLTYTELVDRLFPIAGRIGVHVERDQTVIVGRVHRDELDEFYALFHDVLVEPRMAEEDFRRLRDEAKSQLTLELRGSNDERLGKEALQAALYADHPYGHPTIGTETALDSITLEEVRAQREAVLCRSRVTVGLAGGYPEGFAERLLGDLEALPSSCRPRVELPEVAAPTRTEVLIVDKPEAGSTAISIGLPLGITRAHEDHAALTLATSYFGEHRQFAGVLFQKMRAERGLNYGDYAYAEHFVQAGWSRFARPNVSRRQQYFSIWIRPVDPQRAHFALRLAMRELRRLVEGGFSDEDFARIRTFLDRYVGLFEQTESRRLGYLIDDRRYGLGVPFLQGLRRRWREIDGETVRRAVREHLTFDELQIVIVHKDARTLAEALATDAESPIAYRQPKSEEILAEDREIQAYPLHIARDAIRVVPVAQMFR